MEESVEINEFEIAARMRKVLALAATARDAGACREDLEVFEEADWVNLSMAAGTHLPSEQSKVAVIAIMPTQADRAASSEDPFEGLG